jgi:broad specificity phosphatase PhoE
MREFAGSSVVLVSHVGPIKALLATVLEMPLQSSRRLFLDPGTISVVEWGAQRILRLFNSHAHLGWSSARWM